MVIKIFKLAHRYNIKLVVGQLDNHDDVIIIYRLYFFTNNGICKFHNALNLKECVK